MNDLTLVQEYLICAVNEKGKISSFQTEKLVCLIAAGLLDLQLADCIQIEENSVTVVNELPSDRMHLQDLYDVVDQGKPVTLKKVAEAYMGTLTDKRLQAWMDSIGSSLADLGVVTVVSGGLLAKKKTYVPSAAIIHRIVDMMKAELFEDVEITEEIASLIILLDKSHSLKTYFSAYEQKEIKETLTNLAESDEGRMIKGMIEQVESMIVMMSVFVAACS